jgi:hypothetical protein
VKSIFVTIEVVIVRVLFTHPQTQNNPFQLCGISRKREILDFGFAELSANEKQPVSALRDFPQMKNNLIQPFGIFRKRKTT